MTDRTPPVMLDATGTRDNTTFLRGDGVWVAPAGGPPSGPAGGSLAGTYPNPTLAAGAVNSTEINAAIKDAAAATASLRTLGTGATQAAAGNDARLSDARTPLAHVHAAADVTYAGSTNLAATNVEAALDELDAEKAALTHLGVTGAGVAVYQNAQQVVPHDTVTAISMTTENFDTHNFWVSGTPSRFTIPAGLGGKYLFNGQIRWVSNATGFRVALLYLNGTTIVCHNSTGALSTTSTSNVAARGIQLAAGDYLELRGYHNQGGNWNTEVVEQGGTWMSLFRMAD